MTLTQQTILIVDDTPENIDVLAGILRPHYRIKVAVNGEKALEIASTTPRPDMVLLNVMMPGMDGFEVCRRLKSQSGNARHRGHIRYREKRSIR